MSDENEDYVAYLNPDPNGRAPNTHRVRLDAGFIPEVIEFEGQRYRNNEWDDDDELVYYLEEAPEAYKVPVEDVEEL